MTHPDTGPAGVEPAVVLAARAARGVLLVTINRPEKRNALNDAVRLAMLDALDAAERDPDVRVVVVTGAGHAAFVAGADLQEIDRRTPEEQEAFMRNRRVYDAVAGLSKPTIAAVNGLCLGGGLELALACDLRVAAEGAKFAAPEIKLGMMPGGGATQRLPRVVGAGHALRLVLLGEPIDAKEAHRIGLVHDVVPEPVLRDRAVALAERLAALSPVALAQAKRAVHAALDRPLAEGLDVERECFLRAFASEDRREGVRAFLEKRSPEFRGR